MRPPRSTRRPRVLIALAATADDAIGAHLDLAGFETRRAAPDYGLPAAAAAFAADAVVIDLDAAGPAGLALAEGIVFAAEPGEAPAVLLLDGTGDLASRIVGLEIGADDVLAKPAAPREVAARLRALLGRLGRPVGRGRVVVLGSVGVDVDLQRLIGRDGSEQPLAPSEFALLKCFLDAPDRVFERDELLDLAPASEEDVTDRAIDRRVNRLRRKLEAGDGAAVIEAVRGLGYRLAPAFADSLKP